MRIVIPVFCAALISLAPPLHAHHSLAIYDGNVTATLVGTVTAYDWRNPHVLLHIRTDEMSEAEGDLVFEGGDIGRLTRLGWDMEAVKAGETATVRYNPRHSGEPGGHLIEITSARGEIFSLLRFRHRGEASQIPESAP